jgi:hypothetical protein
MKQQVLARILVATAAGACLVWAADTSGAAQLGGPQHSNSFVFPPNANPHGATQAVWQERFWQWALELPAQDHPCSDTPNYDATEGQSGEVWFLPGVVSYSPGSPITRTCTIPADTSLFVAVINNEWSSLEGYLTESDQRTFSNWQTDHVLAASLSCTLDGTALSNPLAYRKETAQFTFDAPSPWLFGDVGGTGTAVGSGYHVFLKELAPGQHTLHFTGQYHFTTANDGFDLDVYVDMTYLINQL